MESMKAVVNRLSVAAAAYWTVPFSKPWTAAATTPGSPGMPSWFQYWKSVSLPVRLDAELRMPSSLEKPRRHPGCWVG
jgi:hypothetical protein